MTRLAKNATRAKLRKDIVAIVQDMHNKTPTVGQVKDVADWIEHGEGRIPPHGEVGEYVRRTFATMWSQYRGLPE